MTKIETKDGLNVGMYDFAEQALDAEWLKEAHAGLRTKEAIEWRSVQQAVRDILSLPPSEAIPASEEEMRIFHNICCIMSAQSRNWLSTSQIALPHEQLISDHPQGEASLKSRVALSPPNMEQDNETSGIGQQTRVRHRFLNLLSMCIPQQERERYPHLLTLVDGHAMVTVTPPSMTSGVDAGVWVGLCYFQHLMHVYRKNSRSPVKSSLQDLLDIELVQSRQNAALARLMAAIEESPWKLAAAKMPTSKDSLFARLLINAALNRHSWETWAYEKRLRAILPMQAQLVQELCESSPQGLSKVISTVSPASPSDYSAIVELVLQKTLETQKTVLTDNVKKRISAQVGAVLDSAKSGQFAGEQDVNEFMALNPVATTVLFWIILTWCYAHNFKIPNEDPGIHAKESIVVSSRSRLIQAGQDMSSLRRMLMTLVFSHQWHAPSVKRLELHATLNSRYRALMRTALESTFKGSSLAQWEAAILAVSPRAEVFEAVRRAEVGTLMKDYLNKEENTDTHFPTPGTTN